MGVGDERHAPSTLPLGKAPSTHCTGGLVGPRTRLDTCGEEKIFASTGTLIPSLPDGSKSLFRLRKLGGLF